MNKSIFNSNHTWFMAIVLLLSLSECWAAEKQIVKVASGNPKGCLNNFNFGTVTVHTGSPTNNGPLPGDIYRVTITSNGEPTDVALRVLFNEPTDNIPVIKAKMVPGDRTILINAQNPTGTILYNKSMSELSESNPLLAIIEKHKGSFYYLIELQTNSKNPQAYW